MDLHIAKRTFKIQSSHERRNLTAYPNYIKKSHHLLNGFFFSQCFLLTDVCQIFRFKF